MIRLAFCAAAALVAGESAAKAATLVYSPGPFSNNTAANIPQFGNVWTGIAQSITALDTNVSFGFYLFGQGNASVLYSLYAGDGPFGAPLKQVTVVNPAGSGLPSTPVSADFSSVALTVGQRYTFKASLPSEGLPASGTYSGVSAAYATGDNPYSDGRFYFTGSNYNSSFPERDLAFSMTGITAATAVPETSTWAMMILGVGMIGGILRRRRQGNLTAAVRYA